MVTLLNTAYSREQRYGLDEASENGEKLYTDF
jgi:hypothetical protein